MLALLVPGVGMGGSGYSAPVVEPTPTPEAPPAPLPFAVSGPLPVDEDTLRAVRALWLSAGEVSISDTPIDDDTLAAVLAAWRSDVAQLPALFDRPLAAGRLKADFDRPRPMPYAHVSCVFLDRRLVGVKPSSGARKRHWYDWRKVTITIYGTKAQVVEAAQAVLEVFNLDTALTYPSGARHMRWEPLNELRLEEDETARGGVDVWRGVLEAKVQSVRTT